ncbi:MAG: hypothetical protein IT214_02520 [Chitinophagaceae bacterium]|jgi:hypothetical protein|nr:hypothetical protein [Chitinophagaceae bacterium]OQY94107.1 MAG: hypothetical protein B6D37_09345 [Sphingobacteriales bacterium UTBCD1]
MYNVILHLHSGLRWLVLLLLLIVVYRSFFAGSRPFGSTDRKFSLFTLIVCDFMILIGIYQWIAGNWGLESIQANGMKNVMHDPILRFYAIEHPIGMLIAIIMVHIGWIYAKKDLPGAVKHKRVLLFYGLALLIIIVSLPWPFRQAGAGRGWY